MKGAAVTPTTVRVMAEQALLLSLAITSSVRLGMILQVLNYTDSLVMTHYGMAKTAIIPHAAYRIIHHGSMSR
jgi:hypothetical protein